MSKLRLLGITWLFGAVVIASLLYYPVPEGVDDQFGATLFMAIWNLVIRFPIRSSEILGFGPIRNNLHLLKIHTFREGEMNPMTSWLGGLNVTRATIEGVPVIVYRHWDAEGADLRPGCVFMHGGGWISGSADISDWTVYDLTLRTGTVSVSVDYTLAIERPFPAAFDDVVAVTRHILRHGKKFGIDVTRVGVAGDSAGGNLAAATALHLTKMSPESDLPPLTYQVLIHPVLQGVTFRLPSYMDNSEAFTILYAKDMAAFTAVYLGLDPRHGELYSTMFCENRHVSPEFRTRSKFARFIDVNNLPEKYRTPKLATQTVEEAHNDTVFQKIKHLLVDPRFSPLMAEDLSGLPPAMIVVQKFDVLRDDGLLYAKRLKDSGIETVLHAGNGFHIDHHKVTPDFLRPKTGLNSIVDMAKFIKRIVKKD